jgi:hypothetical protein
MMPLGIGLDAAVALLKRFRTLIALAPVLALCAVLWVKLYGFLWWDGAIEQRDKARAQIVAMEAASKEARAKQIALNRTNQELSQRIATDAAIRHAETARAADTAINAYIRANRLRPQACGSLASGTDLAPVHPNPGAPVGPEQSGDLVAIPRDDFEALAREAVRGREAQAFLIDLVNEGLAVVYPEPKLSED